MNEYIENDEVIDRMYNERSEAFESCVNEILLETEKELNTDIENKLKEKFKNEDELFNFLEDISFLCNINCKSYYKMGIIDGIKLVKELGIV